MSTRMMILAATYVRRNQCTSGIAFRVLILAASRVPEGETRAPVERGWMTRVIGCSRASVDLAVRYLTGAGLLTRVSHAHPNGDGTWTPAVYEVLPELTR